MCERAWKLNEKCGGEFVESYGCCLRAAEWNYRKRNQPTKRAQ